MGATHTSRSITVDIFLQALPTPARSFSTILVLLDLADDALASRVVTVTSTADTAALVAASDLSAASAAIIDNMFAQAPRLRQIRLGYVDTAGAETWAEGYAACVAADPDVYGVCATTRTASDLAALSTAIENEGLRRLFAQSSDAEWLTGTAPTAWTAIASNERTCVLYHGTDTDGAAEGYAASYLAFDQDTISPTAAQAVAGITPPTVTAAQRNFCIANNANIGLAFGSAPYFVLEGVSLTGRPLYELTTADWLKARVEEGLADVKVQRSADGLKVPVSIVGQELCLAPIRRLLSLGEDIGHFEPGQTSAQGEEITTADTTAQRVRLTVRAQTQTDAIAFDADIYLSRDPIASEA